MADFWIKIEKGTPDKPEILELADILGIEDPDTVTGKMIRVWSWFDSNSENGHAPIVTKVLLDRMTGVTGLTDALVKVGWLIKTEDGFSVPNFDRHLGKGAKKRASDAERKRKSRERSQECHAESVTKDVTEIGPDKSRVDKIDKDLLSSTHDAVTVLDYMNHICGTKYKHTTKSHIQNINGRLSDGHSVDDLKSVIDFKFREWGGTQQAQYLRPQTLFQAGKFQGYLMAAKSSKPQRDVNHVGSDFYVPEGWNVG